MFGIKLSSLAVLLGLVVALVNGWGLWNPVAFKTAARKFPRHTQLGVWLMVIATAWFLYNLSLEEVSDFVSFKPALYALFAGVGIGTCIFVRDFLPIRALAVLFLLLGKLMVDTARWERTEWRLVIVIWAYVWIIAGMWLTISPWRLRDFIHWSTANDNRMRLICGLRAGFGIFVVLLGLTTFRVSEHSQPATATIGRPVIIAAAPGLPTL